MAPEENQLILNAQNGDIRAFEELVYKYDSKVLSLALRYVGDEDDAKDLYQEVFIRAYKGIKNFQFKSEFSTWLFRITTNVCFTFKSRDRRKNNISVSPGDEDENVQNIELIDNSSSPEVLASGSELGYIIKNALETLSPKQKMTFVLKHYDGYKIREIAEMMECNEGTVKKYLFDATRNLRKKLSFITN
ncbi:MAG: sigma-70 family RNA polymerase sigma factor [Ignavibacterium sp.]|nr:sigma-70 family RNA polymerase sigma factor [Ignavibacterium sp.]